ncbi:hypothetical protein [Dokdonella sp.]|uniref:hypothetical protein n=1 Tax=Dokdonella sp. TaxID=2291710 RepID=UPI001B21592B|nr:hypothetical protein [Dokdonella sp.]MBO9664467.1 hypothetical protein [Dokdonella sp.]
MKRLPIAIALLALTCTTGAFAQDDVDKVNGAIDVKNGERAGNLSTVNGGVRIAASGSAAKVTTVNGGVRLGEQARAASVQTVNGGINLDEGAQVKEGVETVNGGIRLGKSADVGGRAETVNGRIALEAAHIGGGIQTVGGDIEVGADSRVEGGILVKKPSGWSWGTQRKPRIVIGPHATVQGTLEFEREVELFVSDSATIGAVKGATVQKFSGNQP